MNLARNSFVGPDIFVCLELCQLGGQSAVNGRQQSSGKSFVFVCELSCTASCRSKNASVLKEFLQCQRIIT